MHHEAVATIVIAEDTPDIREIVELILSDSGYTVISAGDGERCLAAVRQHRPALVLMDLSMPRVDGWEAIRRLKADARTSAIPVLAFTAHIQERELNDARAAGCAAIITKPFEIDDLLGQITAALQQSGTQRAAA